jgi:hypothetical protein
VPRSETKEGTRHLLRELAHMSLLQHHVVVPLGELRVGVGVVVRARHRTGLHARVHERHRLTVHRWPAGPLGWPRRRRRRRRGRALRVLVGIELLRIERLRGRRRRPLLLARLERIGLALTGDRPALAVDGGRARGPIVRRGSASAGAGRARARVAVHGLVAWRLPIVRREYGHRPVSAHGEKESGRRRPASRSRQRWADEICDDGGGR